MGGNNWTVRNHVAWSAAAQEACEAQTAGGRHGYRVKKCRGYQIAARDLIRSPRLGEVRWGDTKHMKASRKAHLRRGQ